MLTIDKVKAIGSLERFGQLYLIHMGRVGDVYAKEFATVILADQEVAVLVPRDAVEIKAIGIFERRILREDRGFAIAGDPKDDRRKTVGDIKVAGGVQRDIVGEVRTHAEASQVVIGASLARRSVISRYARQFALGRRAGAIACTRVGVGHP